MSGLQHQQNMTASALGDATNQTPTAATMLASASMWIIFMHILLVEIFERHHPGALLAKYFEQPVRRQFRHNNFLNLAAHRGHLQIIARHVR